ncbi:MAG: TonB-dependent receptor plug domain-containing protein, partial [Gemmatimonadaceae bacterium]
MHSIEQRRRGYRLRSIVAALAAIAATSISAAAQTGTVTGRIHGAGDAPVSEARVAIVGTTLVALSGADGKYTIRGVPAGAAEVRVFRVGFAEQKKPATVTGGGTVTLDFAMEASTVKLDEFVVTATGVQRRAEVGNSISVINASERVKETPIHNMGDLLTAKAPGVTVLPGAMSGGGATIRIRGLNSVSRSNAPIFIIDGIRMDGTSGGFGVGGTNSSRLNDITPEEIEDLAVIKGPSAATLYGTDAANGVIIIKTKSGRRGKTQFQYTAERGIITDPNKYWDTFAIWGHTPAAPTVQTRCILTTIASGACVKDSVTSANVMRNALTSPIDRGDRSLYSVQASGGNEAVRFLVSANQERENGPIKMPGIDRDYLTANKVNIRDEWSSPE